MDPCSVVAINLWCWLMPSRTSDEIASFNAVLSAAILLLRRLQQAPMVNLEGCRWGVGSAVTMKSMTCACLAAEDYRSSCDGARGDEAFMNDIALLCILE
jgi:hypothetical protein